MSASAFALVPTLDALPPRAAALLDGAGSLCSSRPWFESFVAAGLNPAAEPVFLALENGRGLLPCARLAPDSRSAPAVAGLSSFYSCDFRPIVAPDDRDAAFALGRAAISAFAGAAVIRFDSLDTSFPLLDAFLAGLKRPGRALLRYAHFGRWWENVEGERFDDYLARRDGALRETIRRKGARLERAGATCFFVPPDAIEQGIAEYKAVYQASWKEPEPFPHFQPVLMRNLAKAGWLRLALCRIGDRPIAAQLWAVVGGAATVLKLAHDQAFDTLSPGTVLTAFAIRTLMNNERIARLDFGRGDDGYKRAWVSERTPHVGVLSVSMARRPELVARHWLGN